MRGQEAPAGFELRASVSGAGFWSQRLTEAPRSGRPYDAGFRTVLYPVVKLSPRWDFSAAVQIASRPYFFEQFRTQGRGVKTDILRAGFSYSRFWRKTSFVICIGQLSSAFGSFLSRYDDQANPLLDVPPAYGYYYASVTVLGIPGAQADVTAGPVDFRVQFLNSSPANRRSLFDSDQYGSWAGGFGYTFRHQFRLGLSAYRGPYLHRGHRFYFPGEAPPRQLPASAYGAELQWGRGHWNGWAEIQRFQRTYRAIPTFNLHAGYGEVRRTLSPRWYAAARIGYLRSAYQENAIWEMAAGYRVNRFQTLKAGYQIWTGALGSGTAASAFALQLVSSFSVVSLSPGRPASSLPAVSPAGGAP